MLHFPLSKLTSKKETNKLDNNNIWSELLFNDYRFVINYRINLSNSSNDDFYKESLYFWLHLPWLFSHGIRVNLEYAFKLVGRSNRPALRIPGLNCANRARASGKLSFYTLEVEILILANAFSLSFSLFLRGSVERTLHTCWFIVTGVADKSSCMRARAYLRAVIRCRTGKGRRNTNTVVYQCRGNKACEICARRRELFW